MRSIRQACWWVGIRMLLAAKWLVEFSAQAELRPRLRREFARDVALRAADGSVGSLNQRKQMWGVI